MPDRRRRTALHLPPPSGPVLLQRERQSSSTGPTGSSGSSGPAEPGDPASGSGSGSGSGSASGSGSGSGSGPGSSGPSSGSSDDNPFAPPPEDRPDQPWRPRHHGGGDSPDDDGSGTDGDRPVWGSQWSSQQPGRSQGGFGSRPGSRNTPDPQNGRPGREPGQGGPEGGRGLRWDPKDPAQRRARYALLAGMWAFFFALFNFPEIALLLGALGLYWGISSLRNKQPAQRTEGRAAAGRPDPFNAPAQPSAEPSDRAPAAGSQRSSAQGGQRPPAGTTGTGKPQTTAAVSGIVTAGLALAIVAATFTVQLVYRDYYTCVDDALTKTGQISCNDELPHSLVSVFGIKE
ncbi:hypothetical protein HY68_06345 [Streptomyces sp. AcH 505]|uniref:hypothetical protein n=1 Tax=Streptomyces sp. AcH 505 TaxID=352211 RepID=UPI00059188D0|nr:hypothetical protein HY68_06345 [Streptomyces sp. AcH 505]